MRRLLPPTAAVALAGAATMALEILLPRRLAPDLGTSLPVWTADFVTVLLGLAIGSSLGAGRDEGAHAGRREAFRWLAAAAAIASAPLLSRFAAAQAAGLSLTPRALVSMAAGGFLPCVALGSIYPIAAARALHGVVERGPTLGRIAAAGAIGSLAGTWLAAYVVIPSMAVPTAMYAVAAIVALMAVFRAGSDPGPSPHRSTTTQSPSLDRSGGGGTPTPTSKVGGRAISTWALLALAALVGALTLALEVVAARRAAVDAGSSLEAWTAVISVVLVGLAVGGAIGGAWSRRSDPRRAAGRALLLSAVLAAATPWTSLAIGAALAHSTLSFSMRVAEGVFAAYGLLFVALGTIPPILSRAVVAQSPHAGRRAGFVYAVGTVGALAGTLVVGPYALPALALEGAAAAAALVLAFAAMAVARHRLVPLVAALSAVALLVIARCDIPSARAAGLAIGLRPDADGVWVRDGAYARISVEDAPPSEIDRLRRPFRRLRIDARIHGVHDVKDPTWVGSFYGSLYAAAAERLAGDQTAIRTLFLGGGTYTAPRAIARRWPQGHVDVAEIDPDVTRAAREELGLGDAPGLSIFHEDARAFVRSLPANAPRYTLVFADAFGDVGVPWHLTTEEFVRECKAHMTQDGVYLANTIDILAAGGFVPAMRATLRSAFKHVEAIGVGRNDGWKMNVVFVASDRPLDLEDLSRIDPADPTGFPLSVYRYPPAELDALEKKVGARPLTDDFAPVEALLAPVVEAGTAR